MVQVDFYYKDERILGFTLSGHANYKQEDQEYDLLCAAISMLSISITNGITDIIKVEPKQLEVEDGYLKCLLPDDLSEAQALQAEALLRTMKLGFENLVQDYSKYICVNKRRWTP